MPFKALKRVLREHKKMSSLKRHISARQKDVALIQRANAGGKIRAGQAGRLATLRAEQGQTIRRDPMGNRLRVDNAGMSTAQSTRKKGFR